MRSNGVFYEDVIPPGLEDRTDKKEIFCGLEYFQKPMGYEIRYQSQVENELDSTHTESVVENLFKVANVWRKIENSGIVYWYNEITQVSQWEAPPGYEEEKSSYHPQKFVASPDDFAALVNASQYDNTTCQFYAAGANREGVVLRVIIKPNQTDAQVLEVTLACAQIAVQASVEDGWCNQAILAFLRRALHIPQRERNNLRIISGFSSLDKSIFIPSLSVKDVLKRLNKAKDRQIVPPLSEKETVSLLDIDKWIRFSDRKRKEEEKKLKRRKWA